MAFYRKFEYAPVSLEITYCEATGELRMWKDMTEEDRWIAMDERRHQLSKDIINREEARNRFKEIKPKEVKPEKFYSRINNKGKEVPIDIIKKLEELKEQHKIKNMATAPEIAELYKKYATK